MEQIVPTLPHETNNVFSTISSPFLTPGTVSKLGDLAPGEITPPPTHIATDTILKNLANHPNCIIGNPFEVRILASSTNLPAVGSCAPLKDALKRDKVKRLLKFNKPLLHPPLCLKPKTRNNPRPSLLLL
jgi:hypothetical protein